MKSMKIALSLSLILLLVSCFAQVMACDGDDDDSDSDNNLDDDTNGDGPAEPDDDTDSDSDYDEDDEITFKPFEFAPMPSNEIGIFVAKTGSDDNPGTMELPKLTISAGIETAKEEYIPLEGISNNNKLADLDFTIPPNKSVFVALGKYYESVVTPDISLYGGYESDLWQRNINRNETSIIATEENALEIKTETHPYPVIEGFSIYGGRSTPDNRISQSAGIEIDGGIVVSNSRIFGGQPEDTSFGIGCDSSRCSARIYNSVIFGSEIDEEGDSSERTVPLNTTGVLGRDSYFVIVNSVIHGGASEQAYYSSGVSLSGHGDFLIINSYIYGGDPMGEGSVSTGISAISGSAKDPFGQFMLFNSIVDGGTGSFRSTAILMFNVYKMSIYNNSLWGSSTDCLLQYGLLGFMCFRSIDYIDELDGNFWSRTYSKIDENISRNCRFVDPDNQDWRLHTLSRCRDMGVNVWLDWRKLFGRYLHSFEGFSESYHLDKILKYDFDGEPRNYGLGWDIGPDEWRPASK